MKEEVVAQAPSVGNDLLFTAVIDSHGVDDVDNSRTIAIARLPSQRPEKGIRAYVRGLECYLCHSPKNDLEKMVRKQQFLNYLNVTRISKVDIKREERIHAQPMIVFMKKMIIEQDDDKKEAVAELYVYPEQYSEVDDMKAVGILVEYKPSEKK